jgi:O-antigen ligase
LIFVSSGVFIIFSGAKTANFALILVFLSAIPAFFVKSNFLRILIILSPPLILNLIGAGQLLFAPIGSLVQSLPIDSTFTGRTRIWGFTIENINRYPIFGYGFSSFWESEFVKTARVEATEAGVWAHSAHQSYLDIAVAIGLPGLILFVNFAIVQPLKDLNMALSKGHDKETLFFLLLIFQFFLCISTMESIMLGRFEFGWFFFVFSIFGLRYMSQYDIQKGEE